MAPRQRNDFPAGWEGGRLPIEQERNWRGPFLDHRIPERKRLPTPAIRSAGSPVPSPRWRCRYCWGYWDSEQLDRSLPVWRASLRSAGSQARLPGQLEARPAAKPALSRPTGRRHPGAAAAGGIDGMDWVLQSRESAPHFTSKTTLWTWKSMVRSCIVRSISGVAPQKRMKYIGSNRERSRIERR